MRRIIASSKKDDSSDRSQPSVWTLPRVIRWVLNENATEFKRERESLYAEQRVLNASLGPLADYVDALPLRETLQDFAEIAREAEPLEMHRLMRTLLRRV